ncbi:MAG: type II toxin-antitoxin system RelE/ParE family toxin [Elusimicrobia bacterium]|nr:type II toxin-antitoxin system RelE/ParE family toxin [Elusimicrobiota bacterium]
MPYRIEILPAAIKEYHRVPQTERAAVKKAILGLEHEPRGPQVKKLQGREYYRLRAGHWRVIFAISDPRKLVTVIAVERRTSTTY